VRTSVLVIDDDPTFRGLAVRMLEGMGLAVVGEADSAATASVAAGELRPQAALVDVGLPDGSGIALAAELSALPWRPRVVLTSVDSDAITDSAARSAGATGFIAKNDLPDGRLRVLLGGEEHPG